MQARLEDAAQCLLVIIGATPEGKQELVGLIDGVRESAQSWRELLLDLKRRGLASAQGLKLETRGRSVLIKHDGGVIEFTDLDLVEPWLDERRTKLLGQWNLNGGRS